ncbi:MAG: hypothetical protein EZS28_045768, partial [Streblomastix strix]
EAAQKGQIVGDQSAVVAIPQHQPSAALDQLSEYYHYACYKLRGLWASLHVPQQERELMLPLMTEEAMGSPTLYGYTQIADGADILMPAADQRKYTARQLTLCKSYLDEYYTLIDEGIAPSQMEDIVRKVNQQFQICREGIDRWIKLLPWVSGDRKQNTPQSQFNPRCIIRRHHDDVDDLDIDEKQFRATLDPNYQANSNGNISVNKQRQERDQKESKEIIKRKRQIELRC